jgi:hypothetical protein
MKYSNISMAVKFLVHGAIIFMAHFREVEPPLLMEKAAFLDQATRWGKPCMDGNE